MPQSVNRLFHVLLVEDNPGDVLLMKEVFRHSQRQVQLHVAQDGEQAMDFVRKTAQWRDAPTPDLILMDLNLPRYDGWEVLRSIKASPVLCRIPVVVLTTSAAPRDVLLSYDLHANSFVTKPVDFDQFIEIMRNIETFWLSTSLLPTNL
jgi:CheY-like chemotaxis protein